MKERNTSCDSAWIFGSRGSQAFPRFRKGSSEMGCNIMKVQGFLVLRRIYKPPRYYTNAQLYTDINLAPLLHHIQRINTRFIQNHTTREYLHHIFTHTSYITYSSISLSTHSPFYILNTFPSWLSPLTSPNLRSPSPSYNPFLYRTIDKAGTSLRHLVTPHFIAISPRKFWISSYNF